MIERMFRIMTMVVFTGEIQAISKINNSKVLVKLFKFIFSEYRQEVKDKYGQVDVELERQFVVLVSLLKHMTRGLRLSTEVHEAIEEKILMVYTRYEVEEMLD